MVIVVKHGDEFIFPCANGNDKVGIKVQKVADPIKFGKDPKFRKNTAEIIQEKRTTDLIMQNNNKMRWKRRMISGVCLEASSVGHNVQERQKVFAAQAAAAQKPVFCAAPAGWQPQSELQPHQRSQPRRDAL